MMIELTKEEIEAIDAALQHHAMHIKQQSIDLSYDKTNHPDKWTAGKEECKRAFAHDFKKLQALHKKFVEFEESAR